MNKTRITKKSAIAFVGDCEVRVCEGCGEDVADLLPQLVEVILRGGLDTLAAAIVNQGG